ncbi:hypothetical protein GUITHDRAFT_64626 [Guillardia theta CCMP2712]|uniref:Acetate transporter n=2 Tax=Guillardia theta TaxID=55529 RepID=L1JXL8_GUITC|nr:hypothetical protein GUITHDRAFT_64626 [Guillardia theta CCMP2712]EKX52960.1 hypothetical protein GUITHDRAFT_64626 [Guillardia theta CCMP2712]|eukprot:XP_005839940.1 hypothetical protein GUITHDRAFT_64626 [Guillardia theta CCMP2712]
MAAQHWKPADPAPLGLSGFAVTTFLLSGFNAGWIPFQTFLGAAAFYGGFAQLLAGMWEFANGNVFGATAFSSYGAFWMSLFVMVNVYGATPLFSTQLAYFLVAFLIFNSYALVASMFTNAALFLLFALLEVTLILDIAANFTNNTSLAKAGGYCGIVCASTAWYIATASLVNGTARRHILPLGRPVIRLPKPSDDTEMNGVQQTGELTFTLPVEQRVWSAHHA